MSGAALNPAVALSLGSTSGKDPTGCMLRLFWYNDVARCLNNSSVASEVHDTMVVLWL